MVVTREPATHLHRFYCKQGTMSSRIILFGRPTTATILRSSIHPALDSSLWAHLLTVKICRLGEQKTLDKEHGLIRVYLPSEPKTAHGNITAPGRLHQVFYRRSFNPYLNFQRLCGQPERIVDARGKEKFVYRCYATPWETLRQLLQALPEVHSYLRAWTGSPTPTAIPSQPGVCKRPGGRCSPASSRGGKAHDARFTGRGAPWK